MAKSESYQDWRDQFVYQMALEGVPLHVAKTVMKEAERVQAHAVAMCNYQPTKTQDTRAENAGKRIVEALKPYGIKADLGGDPRGACVKLHLKSKRYNTWGGEESGYAVPVRSR